MTNSDVFPEKDDRSPVYYDDEVDKWVLRMSDAGICVTAIVALKLGKRRDPPSKTILAAYQDGINAEADIEANAIATYNLNPTGQVRIELDLNDDWVLRGHCDGYAPPYLLEYKNLSADYFNKFKRGGLEKMGDLGKKYAIQTYCYAIGLESQYGIPITEVLFHCKERVREGQVDHQRYFGRSYSCGDLGKLGNISLDILKTKVAEADRYVAAKDLPRCDLNKFGCPVWTLHNSMDVFDTRGSKKVIGPDVATFAIAEIDDHVEEYKVVVEARKIAEKREKELKEVFREVMESHELKKYVAPDGRITLGMVSSHSSKLDEKAMEEDGIDLEKYRVTKDYTYLREF